MADIIAQRFAAGNQTFIIPLTLTNILDAAVIITIIGYGGDIWELRVDLSSPPGGQLGKTNFPLFSFVEELWYASGLNGKCGLRIG